MNIFFTLLKKDLSIELRGKELLYSIITLSLLVSFFFGLAFENAFLEQKVITRIFPIALWISFIFASTVSVSRSLYYEVEFDALSSLVTLQISPALIYLSKVTSNVIITFISFVCLSVVLSALLGVTVKFGLLLAIGAFVCIGYGALATLLANLVLQTKLKDLLLPLILFPLLFPLFFAGYELTNAFATGSSEFYLSPWATLLITIDLLYLSLGALLFGAAVKG